ncbi:MAG: hypothetical protein II782_03705 [Oscillospiraceae bacterium]|nr:hypothetical protein [Oscillospiraceae bacterium]
MKRKRSTAGHDRELILHDGTKDNESYDAAAYEQFISNGMTDNEKIDAVEYFESFLSGKGKEG